MNVLCYSLKDDGNKKITEHFAVKEFKCKDGTDPVFISPMLVSILEEIRMHYGKPVYINSGYRTPPYNEKTDGAKYSKHMLGIAADIHIKGVKPSDLAKYVRSIMPYYGGIGVYKSFVHVDVRSKKTDWTG